MDPILKHISDFTQGTILTKENLSFFYINIRQILEKENISSEYPKILFFSNWLVHPELSRKNTTESILIKMRTAIIEHFKEQTEIATELSKIINLAKLREELIEFLDRFNIDFRFIKRQQDWNNMELILLHLLIEKPVFFEKLPELKTEANIEYNFKGFKLIEFEGAINYELLSNELEVINSRIVIALHRL